VIDPATAFRLDGKTALVTGGTRGIGRAIAEAFAAAGAGVCVLARKKDELDETEAALAAAGGRVAVYAGSAGDPEAIEASVAHCLDQLGGVDILVNNAATNPTFGPMIETEPRAVRKVLEVNVEGPLLLAQAAWRAWMREHGGVIINVASLGALRPSLGIGMYNASKSALIHMTRQLALELAPGVRVNAVAPTYVATPLTRFGMEGSPEMYKVWLEMTPMGRVGQPEEIASTVLFLASDASSLLTGSIILADGGYTCW
jgi:3-oxoacyl-[acyl-carrier protein] reductase